MGEKVPLLAARRSRLERPSCPQTECKLSGIGLRLLLEYRQLQFLGHGMMIEARKESLLVSRKAHISMSC